MEVINFAEKNSVINRFMAELRDVNIQTDRIRFRRNLERIGEIMAYEISHRLHYSEKKVKTPLGTAHVNLPDDTVVLATILRAGLPFHQGFLSCLDDAENAFACFEGSVQVGLFVERFNIALYRAPETLEPVEYYCKLPTDIEERLVVLVDPMLATGGSMELSYKALLTKGTPKDIHIASVIASRQAIDYVKDHFPENTTIWVGAIDDKLDEHSYIVPGLGDAGDLAYGIKE